MAIIVKLAPTAIDDDAELAVFKAYAQVHAVNGGEASGLELTKQRLARVIRWRYALRTNSGSFATFAVIPAP
jgi:hypothetical protein